MDPQAAHHIGQRELVQHGFARVSLVRASPRARRAGPGARRSRQPGPRLAGRSARRGGAVLKLSGLERLAQSANAEPVGEPRKRASAMAAAVMKVRKLTDAAYERLGADPEEHDIERAWDMIEAAPHEIEADRLSSRTFVTDNGLEEDDPNALVAVEATHDLARELRTVLHRAPEGLPEA